ncbi:MAG: amino acid adenylation domain-containing protein [Holosporaceae bacterium]|jgi:fengycin family lipopeptide synthetase B|nr:amino acid adenylation domain-containing protein [Holosporaceae bacterium]
MFLEKIIENAKSIPEAGAVEFNGAVTSYKELVSEANKFAEFLKKSRIKKGHSVIVYHSRNIDLIIKILGIFIAEGIYVPIDKNFPEGRLQEIADQLNSFAIVRDSDVEFFENCFVNDNPNLAYILFTSGSTGKPKGVCLGYDNINSFLDWVDKFYSESELEKTLFSTSISFDLSIFEIFAPLIKGKTILLVDKITDLIDNNRISPTLINTVPSAARALLETTSVPKSVTTFNIAGEPLTQNIVDELYKLENIQKVYNLYGPTECTTYATCFLTKRNTKDTFVSIGGALSNAKIIVVDEQLQEVSSETKGEILIGGQCVGIGYYGNQKSTDEKFVTLNGERFYRTEDIGFVKNDLLFYCGRIDHQIKMRGYRIELLEIEERMISIAGVTAAAVIYLEDRSEIFACICADSDQESIAENIKKYLPDYMIPTIKIFDKLPLNNNGKTDRIKLKEILLQTKNNSIESNNDLIKIAKKVLKKESINPEKNFFENGGHSLLAVQFLNEIKKQLKWNISIQDIFKAESLINLMDKFEPKFQELFPWERRFVAFENMSQGLGVYNMAYAFKLNDSFDVNTIDNAVSSLQKNFPILNTRFVSKNGHFYRSIGEQEKLQVFDDDSTEVLNEFSFRAFDFFGGSLIRFGLFNKNIIVIVCHHSILDGHSFQIILESFFNLLNGKIIQEQTLISWNTDESLLEEFKNIDTSCEMQWPITNRRDLKFDYVGRTKKIEIPRESLGKLEEILKVSHSNISNFILVIYAVTLSKFCRQKNFNVGVPFGNRLTTEEENSLGCFVNLLPIPFCFENSEKISTLIEYSRDKIWEYLAKQRVLFDDLIGFLKALATLSCNPIFQAVFVKLPDMTEMCEKHKVSEVELQFPHTKYDCTLQLIESRDKIILGLEYATSLINDQKAELLLDLIIENINNYKDDFEKTTDDFIYVKNATASSAIRFEKKETIVDLFENACKQYSDSVAVTFCEESITYSELDRKSSILASIILSKSKDSGVAIRMSAGIDLIVAILSVLKTGKMYIPIDPIVPDTRAKYILSDSGTKCIITNIDCDFECDAINISDVDFAADSENVNCYPKPDDYAYMIYTTGTTGNPKGTRITHHNVVRLFKATGDEFKFNGTDVWCLFHSYGFDFSVWEMFGALLFGGKLIIPTREEILSPQKFYEFIEKNQVSVLNQTPSALRSVLKEWNRKLPSLRYIVSGGEALEPSVIKEWSASPNFNCTKLINMYGITETTVHNTYYEVIGSEKNSAIGVPLKDLDIYLVDENTKVVSDGLKGEIIVAGDGVSCGYFNKDEITRKKFVRIPSIDERLFYRSGDLAIGNDDGNLIYLGRIDRQIQLRGFRIELAEIELKAFEFIKKQCVATVESINSEDCLSLYVKSSDSLDKGELRLFLSKNLPSYMVPNYICCIDEFPLNMNGKINFEALKKLKAVESEAKELILTPEEKIVKEVCEEILACNIVDISKNFFELGAHSFSIIKIAKKLEEHGYKIDVLDLFVYSNVKDLAAFLQTKKENS